MSNIPKATKLVIEAMILLKQALDLMPREKSISRAPATARKVTPTIKAQIRAMKARNPTMAIRDIGRALNVDGGRVSEVLHGKR